MNIEFVFTKLHFRIGPMTILVLHQAVLPTFYNKIAPMLITHFLMQKNIYYFFILFNHSGKLVGLCNISMSNSYVI